MNKNHSCIHPKNLPEADLARGTMICKTTNVRAPARWSRRGVKTMDIQEEIRNELLRLGVPITSLGGFQFDSSEEPEEVRVDYEGVTGTFDPEDLLSLLKILPDKAGSIVVIEALRLSRDRR